MFKTLLCIPPDYDYNFPPLGTPALAGFLKHKGFEVEQMDLNLKYRDFLLEAVSGTDDKKIKRLLLRDLLKELFKEKFNGRYYSRFLPKGVEGVLPDLPYDNNSNSSFYFTERLLSAQCLWQYLEDGAENTFYQFFAKEKIIDFLDKEKINCLGISLVSPTQVIAGLTLGLLVKKNLPHVHVVIGGQWPTLYRKEIIKRQDLFKCFDSMIVFEGETPLYKLIKALESGKLLKISNVILKGTKEDYSRIRTEEDMDSLPCPDFSGLELSGYNDSSMSKTQLTFETSRGCYWSKCAYCVDLPLPKPSYRAKSARSVVRDIKQLQKKHKATNLMFGDPGISPRQMDEISKLIIKEGIKINWWTMARLDEGFSPEIFKKAYQAGLRQVNFGFESACDRVCDLLDKGNRKERSLRIIRDCAGAGIRVDLQTMIGLPHETLQDGLETVDFLVTNKKFIDHVTFNIYYLTPANYVYANPEKYGIKYIRNKDLPFGFFIPFKNLKGMNYQDAKLLEKIHSSLIFKSENAKAGKSGTKTRFKKGNLKFNLNDKAISLKYVYNRSSGVLSLKDE